MHSLANRYHKVIKVPQNLNIKMFRRFQVSFGKEEKIHSEKRSRPRENKQNVLMLQQPIPLQVRVPHDSS